MTNPSSDTGSPQTPGDRATPSPVPPNPPASESRGWTKRSDPARYRYAHYETIRAAERRREQRSRAKRNERKREARARAKEARESGEPLPGDHVTLNILPAESYFLATEGHSNAVESRIVLLSALSALPSRQAEVIYRRHWLGDSWEDVSADMNLSRRTLRDAEKAGLESLRVELSVSDF